MNPGSVCAVVVTYNRKELLRKCLHAILQQTSPVANIVVVNNASTDDTLGMLAAEFPAEQFPQLAIVTLPKNSGGAGGFHEGMKHGATYNTEWLWLLDDDTIARPNTLEELLAARDRFRDRPREPVVIASKVVWTDGSLHDMNAPWRRQDDPEDALDAAERGCATLRGATFVSVLIRRDCVEKFGLPLADYFIWGDDTEYTARILRGNLGIIVPTSVVVHETAINHTARNAEPAKFYYFVRNELWLTFRSSALKSNERVKRAISVMRNTAVYLQQRHFDTGGVKAVVAGAWAALTTRPLR